MPQLSAQIEGPWRGAPSDQILSLERTVPALVREALAVGGVQEQQQKPWRDLVMCPGIVTLSTAQNFSLLFKRSEKRGAADGSSTVNLASATASGCSAAMSSSTSARSSLLLPAGSAAAANAARCCPRPLALTTPLPLAPATMLLSAATVAVFAAWLPRPLPVPDGFLCGAEQHIGIPATLPLFTVGSRGPRHRGTGVLAKLALRRPRPPVRCWSEITLREDRRVV